MGIFHYGAVSWEISLGKLFLGEFPLVSFYMGNFHLGGGGISVGELFSFVILQTVKCDLNVLIPYVWSCRELSLTSLLCNVISVVFESGWMYV